MSISVAATNGDHRQPLHQYGTNRARTSRASQISIFLAVFAIHLAIFFLFYLGVFAPFDGAGRSGAVRGSVNVFSFSDVLSAAPTSKDDHVPADGGTGGLRAAGELSKQPALAQEHEGAGAGDRAGDASLGDMIASVLADDPAGGGDWISYEAILRRHIARYRQHPDKAGGRGRTGIVVVRFNVDRDGRIVDARILKTQGASLDEAALAALWRAEPLPVVPAALPTPLEIDVPIDFRVRG
jgi:protein TonB